MEPRDKMKENKLALNGRLLLLLVGIMLVFNGITSSGRNGLGWLGLADAVEEIRNTPQEEKAAPEETASEEAAPAQDGAETEEAAPAQGGAETEEETAAAATETTGETAAQMPDLDELVRQMEASGISTSDLRLLGILSLIITFFEVCVGLLCAFFSNRVNKSKITLTGVIVLLVAEVAFVAVYFVKGALTLSLLLNSIFLPLVLLWSATRLRKLAKLDPERIYAVTPARDRGFSANGRKAEKKPSAPSETPAKSSIRDKAMWKSDSDENESGGK